MELGCDDVTWIELAPDHNQKWAELLISTAKMLT
jgi:hypothetical protein